MGDVPGGITLRYASEIACSNRRSRIKRPLMKMKIELRFCFWTCVGGKFRAVFRRISTKASGRSRYRGGGGKRGYDIAQVNHLLERFGAEHLIEAFANARHRRDIQHLSGGVCQHESSLRVCQG